MSPEKWGVEDRLLRRSTVSVLTLAALAFVCSLWVPPPWDLALVMLTSLAAGATVLLICVSRADVPHRRRYTRA
jgi:hypothetical protein